MSDAEKVTKLFMNLCLAFGISVAVEEKRIILYGKLLMEEFTVEEIENGFIQLIKNRQNSFFPTLGNIREAIFASMNNKENAEKYAEGIMKCLKKHGIYNNGNFEDPLFETAVISLGGWKRLCALPAEETKTLLTEKLKYLMEDKKRIKNNRNKKSKLIIGGISDYTRKSFLHRLDEKKPGLLLK